MVEVFLLCCLQSPLFVLWGRLFKLPSHSLSPPLTPHSLSVFQTSDAVCPMIQNSLQCPPADELKVFLWHSRPWWRIQRQEANKKIFSLRKWERRSRSMECTCQVKLRFWGFFGMPEVMNDINKTLMAMASQGHQRLLENALWKLKWDK